MVEFNENRSFYYIFRQIFWPRHIGSWWRKITILCSVYVVKKSCVGRKQIVRPPVRRLTRGKLLGLSTLILGNGLEGKTKVVAIWLRTACSTSPKETLQRHLGFYRGVKSALTWKSTLNSALRLTPLWIWLWPNRQSAMRVSNPITHPCRRRHNRRPRGHCHCPAAATPRNYLLLLVDYQAINFIHIYCYTKLNDSAAIDIIS